jgi:hypothetical protein
MLSYTRIRRQKLNSAPTKKRPSTEPHLESTVKLPSAGVLQLLAACQSDIQGDGKTNDGGGSGANEHRVPSPLPVSDWRICREGAQE